MSSIIRQIFNIFPRFSTKKAARRRCRAVFSFFPEQVVDGGAESGRQIVQLVVSDDSLPFSILLMTFCVTSSPMIWSL